MCVQLGSDFVTRLGSQVKIPNQAYPGSIIGEALASQIGEYFIPSDVYKHIFLPPIGLGLVDVYRPQVATAYEHLAAMLRSYSSSQSCALIGYGLNVEDKRVEDCATVIAALEMYIRSHFPQEQTRLTLNSPGIIFQHQLHEHLATSPDIHQQEYQESWDTFRNKYVWRLNLPEEFKGDDFEKVILNKKHSSE